MPRPAYTPDARIRTLLHHMEKVARSRPGLYPVTSRDDFLRLAADHLGLPAGSWPEWALPDRETLAAILESFSRHPEITYQYNAQSLIKRGAGERFRTGSLPPREAVG
jgi:hypothetical protein